MPLDITRADSFFYYIPDHNVQNQLATNTRVYFKQKKEKIAFDVRNHYKRYEPQEAKNQDNKWPKHNVVIDPKNDEYQPYHIHSMIYGPDFEPTLYELNDNPPEAELFYKELDDHIIDDCIRYVSDEGLQSQVDSHGKTLLHAVICSEHKAKEKYVFINKIFSEFDSLFLTRPIYQVRLLFTIG